MEKSLKVGILRETKNPPDRRVPLTPNQIINLKDQYPDIEFFVQPGVNRCYPDEEYKCMDIPVKEDLTGCDILMGVKEIDKKILIAGKTYLFFAHVAKKQPYNRKMFRELAEKKITLIDYEYLVDATGQRVVAFGRFAGIVGAYNGLRARGIQTKAFNLKPAYQCHDLDEMWAGLERIKLNTGLKILVTGDGRVAHGAMETLNMGNIVRVSPEEFLKKNFNDPVFCQIGPEHYIRHKSGRQFIFSHFVGFPEEYESTFLPYTRVTDILIAGHYWDPRSPLFITKEDMKRSDFRISVIADISCDINGPIASTLRATSISDPFYGYNPHLETEEPAFSRSSNITVMSVDNLPGELPRDSSNDFGNQLMDNVLGDLFSGNNSPAIERATILRDGELTLNFIYLKNYLNG